jgi:hypothetical protein
MSDNDFRAFQIRSGSDLITAHELKMFLLRNKTRERLTVTPSGVALDPKGVTAVSKITQEISSLENSGIISIENLDKAPEWVNEELENTNTEAAVGIEGSEQVKTSSRKSSKKSKEPNVAEEVPSVSAVDADVVAQAEDESGSTEGHNNLENAQETSITSDESGDNVNTTSDLF